jgi:hypothetical protein
MKKNFKNSFFNSLITSDFFLLDNNNVTKKNFYINQQFNTIKTPLQALNLCELVKSMKQFVRLLQFLKRKKITSLNIKLDDPNSYNLLKKLLVLYPLKSVIIKLKKTLTFASSSAFKLSFLLLLDQTASIKEKNFIKRLYNNNIFLVTKINSNIESNNSSFYKIYNDLIDIKKTIFLMSLIKKIFSKSIKKQSNNAINK